MSLQLSYGRTLVPLPLPPAFVPSKREEGCCSKSPRQRQLPNKGESNKFLGSLVTIKKFLWPRHYSSILNYLKTWPHWAVVVEQWKLEGKAAAAEKKLVGSWSMLVTLPTAWAAKQASQQPYQAAMMLKTTTLYKVTTRMPIRQGACPKAAKQPCYTLYLKIHFIFASKSGDFYKASGDILQHVAN